MENNKIDKVLFGQRLKELMDTAHENTYSMGRTFKLSPPTISRYIHGEMKPKITTIEQMANYFDVNPEWLMGQTVNRFKNEILADDVLSDNLSEITIFDQIRFDLPLFSNHRIDEVLKLPVKNITKWGGIFGFKIPDDSMSPALKKNDLSVIQINPHLKEGGLIALHVNQNDMIIRKVVIQGNRMILQPHNPEFNAETYLIKDNSVHIIGKVIYAQRLTEFFF